MLKGILSVQLNEQNVLCALSPRSKYFEHLLVVVINNIN